MTEIVTGAFAVRDVQAPASPRAAVLRVSVCADAGAWHMWCALATLPLPRAAQYPAVAETILGGGDAHVRAFLDRVQERSWWPCSDVLSYDRPVATRARSLVPWSRTRDPPCALARPAQAV